MTLPEIQTIQVDPQSPVVITNLYDIEDYIFINDYVALKVVNVSNSYDRNNPISITLNGGVVYGDLIFTKDKDIKIDEMSDYEFISFLTFADFSDWTNEYYKFDTDFLLIKSEYFLDYISDYEKTSMLWGGFTHPLNGILPNTIYKKRLTSIDLGVKLNDFDPYSYESCIRAIEQPYAFERFLKLYHLLELQFDYFIINKIKSLTIPGDSNKIGKILNEYSNKELDRLTEIISHNCTDIIKLEQLLSKVTAFPVIAEDMFFNFGKSTLHIHLPNITRFRSVINTGNFTTVFLSSAGVHQNNPDAHTKFIISISSYWIYRIRCSIAHNKIGEYLLSWNDENFIVEFGEPLLKEVLMQSFKK
jgi:hypothetical protein